MDRSYAAMTTFDGLPLPGMVRRDDGVIVLTDSHDANPDTDIYRAWLAAGNAPAPAAPPAPPPRTQLGGTFLSAIADLGWWGWMDQGAAAQASAGKPLDARYWQAIGKADLVLATDAKLARVAAAAERARVAASGQPTPAQPVITIGAVFDRVAAFVPPRSDRSRLDR